jgi:hypothetical protein
VRLLVRAGHQLGTSKIAKELKRTKEHCDKIGGAKESKTT